MSSPSPRPSYAMVLRESHARTVFAAALLGRFSYGIVFVALMVALTRATGSYAWAGTAIALFGLSTAFLAPLRAGLIDRYGPRRSLPPMATAYAALLGCLAMATWRSGFPQWGLLTLTLLAGACAPPLGPVMRTIWSELFSGREELRQRAFSLDTVAEELLYVTGPLAAGLFIAFGNPAAGVAASALLVLSGTWAMVLNPAMRPRAKRTAPQVPMPGVPDTTADPADPDVPAEPGDTGAPVLSRRLGTGPLDPILVAGAVGFALGALNLLVVAFVELHDHQLAAVAWLEASTSVGSAIGGIAYGARHWRLSGRIRLPLLALGLGLALSITGLSTNLYVLALGVAVIGLFIAPALATAYLTADESAPPGARTRAGTWVNSAFNGGSSGGTASIGLLLGGVPLTLCFALAAIPAFISVSVALVRLRAVDTRGVAARQPRDA
ncbi:MFS transporter [Streptomyces scopuliridis]|uniref:MFS transporter n=1 Tax=Streptomyces scopuliridis TaxID=452529 RepID=UPI00368E258F